MSNLQNSNDECVESMAASKEDALGVIEGIRDEDVEKTESPSPKSEGSTMIVSSGSVLYFNGGKGKKGGAKCCHAEVEEVKYSSQNPRETR